MMRNWYEVWCSAPLWWRVIGVVIALAWVALLGRWVWVLT